MKICMVGIDICHLPTENDVRRAAKISAVRNRSHVRSIIALVSV